MSIIYINIINGKEQHRKRHNNPRYTLEYDVFAKSRLVLSEKINTGII